MKGRLRESVTTPSGGTSDYASEMIHCAAQGLPYVCFVRSDTRIPFMAMPDAVDALLALADARPERLTKTAYNVAAFSATAEAIRARVVAAFPDSAMSWSTDEKRQAIIDSWPEDVDDTAARRDWGFSPRLAFEGTFADYLIPTIRERYAR